MRISDWSSDVGSSDLRGINMRHDLAALSRRALGLWIFGGLAVVGIILLSGAMFWTAFASGFDRQNNGNWRSSALEVVEATAEIRSGMRDRQDRKSVVQGQMCQSV